MFRRLLTTFCLAGITLPGLRADEPPLPFSIKVTEEKIDPLPDYMGPTNPTDMDFPFCPIKIDGEFWVIYKNGYHTPVFRYKGTDMEHTVRQPDGAATFPIRGPYILGGMWYDQETKTLYAPMHGEVATYMGAVRREVHLASSTDKGLTWKYLGPILTSPPDLDLHQSPTTESGFYWDGGDGDHVIYVDERGGYIYLFTNHYFWPKLGANVFPIMEQRAARCAIADKMAPGKWKKFYNGGWTEPGLGGKGCYGQGYVVTYNTYLKKYLSFGGSSSISVCTDLAKQDWTPFYNIGPYWAKSGQWAVWPTDESKQDVDTSGQTFYAYNFWQNSPGRRFHIELGSGTTPGDKGFSPPIFSTEVRNYWSADGAPCYTYAPLFESDDPIMARHTRRVGCTSAENTYTGSWSDIVGQSLYEGRGKTASTTGADLTFKFTGKDIYWRAVKGPDLGKADVYLDGTLRATVDCWASVGNPLPMAFVKQGLSDGEHTIRIVVKGEKNPLSSGTAIKHMLFEYSADTYRASDGFSSIAGKNQWTNQERNGTTFTDLTFSDPLWKSSDGCQIGFDQMAPGAGDAVRKWTAPHDGMVRLEGSPALDGINSDGTTVVLRKNTDKIWSTPLPNIDLEQGEKMSRKDAAAMNQKILDGVPYDTKTEVKTGDSIEFIVQNSATKPASVPELQVASKNTVELNARDGKPLKIGSKEFTRGLAFHANGEVTIHLSEPAMRLAAVIGGHGSAQFFTSTYSVKVGKRVLFQPGMSQKKPDGQDLWLDLNGATDITLTSESGLDWGDAKIIQVDGKEVWLGDLPLQDHPTPTSRVLWDPVITYIK